MAGLRRANAAAVRLVEENDFRTVVDRCNEGGELFTRVHRHQAVCFLVEVLDAALVQFVAQFCRVKESVRVHDNVESCTHFGQQWRR